MHQILCKCGSKNRVERIPIGFHCRGNTTVPPTSPQAYLFRLLTLKSGIPKSPYSMGDNTEQINEEDWKLQTEKQTEKIPKHKRCLVHRSRDMVRLILFRLEI